MSLIAKQDRLFLKYDAQRTVAANNLHGLRHVLDLTTSLLDRLHGLSGSSLAKQRNNHGSSCCSSLKCEKLVANLEHLLQCLQQAAFEALISHALEERLDGDILHWRQHWQQRRRRNEGWFAEWPNGQHPLNTTWPWNVKPSLVVLWGVCWMFYDNEGWMVRESRGHVNESVNLWTRQPHQQLVPPFLTASTPQAATGKMAAAFPWAEGDSSTNHSLRGS